MEPKPGDVLHVDSRASVQFSGDRSLIFRVIKVCDRLTYDRWVWLTGYVLDRTGKALDRREIYVQSEGLRVVAPLPQQASGARRRGQRAKQGDASRAGRQERRSDR